MKCLQVPVDLLDLDNELTLGVGHRSDAPQDVLLALALHHVVADASILAHALGESSKMVTDTDLVLGIVPIFPSAALLLLLSAAVVDDSPLCLGIDLALE